MPLLTELSGHNISASALYNRVNLPANFGVSSPGIGGTSTVGTLTINVADPVLSGTSLRIQATASDTSYVVTSFQVYLDGTLKTTLSSAGPLDYTITGITPGAHTVVTKAWNSHGDNSPITSHVYFASGSPVTVIDTSGTTIPVNTALQDLSLNTAQPVNLSQLSVRTLMPDSWTGRTMMFAQAWFEVGGSAHIGVGYTSNDADTVDAILADMHARGVDCVVVDWYGPSVFSAGGADDSVLDAIAAKIGSYSGMTFAVSIDYQYFAKTSTAVSSANMAAAINHIATRYFSHERYEKYSGNPIVLMWNVASQAGDNINWTTVQAAIPAGTKVIQYQASGFSVASSAGSFFWLDPANHSPADGTGYLTSVVFPAITANQAKICISSVWPGFNGTLTGSSAWSLGKYIDRQNGQTWLNWWQANADFVSSGGHLDYVLMGTWDDYEEGSALQAGIRNNLAITSSLTGDTLSFSVTGNENTIARYDVYASADGVNGTKLATVEPGAGTFDLSAASLAYGAYTVFIHAYGKPCVVNTLHQVGTQYFKTSTTTTPTVSTTSAAVAVSGNGYGVRGYGEGGYGGGGSTYSLSYYLSLFTSQYQSSPKFLAWARACLLTLDDTSVCIDNLINDFDLDYAVGAQMDILGRLIGCSRTLPFQPSNGVSPILDDSTYRILLKARIAWNAWDGRLNSLQAIWQNLFPGGRIIVSDNQNMTVDIVLAGAFSSIIQDLISNGYIVPRPQGVLINYTFATLPVLGFDQNNDYVAGFDLGHFA